MQAGVLSKPLNRKGNGYEWASQLIEHYRTRGKTDDSAAAKLETERWRARKLELQVLETSGELVRAADVVRTWSAAFSTCKAKMLSLGTSLADELEGITDKAIRLEIIQDAILDALEELGTGEIVSGATRAFIESGDGDEATAEADGE